MKIPCWSKYTINELDEYIFHLHNIIILLSPHNEKELRQKNVMFKLMRKKQMKENKYTIFI